MELFFHLCILFFLMAQVIFKLEFSIIIGQHFQSTEHVKKLKEAANIISLL